MHVDFLYCKSFNSVSCEARIYYLKLNQFADDDGFVELYRIPYNDKESELLSELENEKLVYKIKESVYLLKHWNLNNNVRCDRYRPSVYEDKKSGFVIDSNYCYIPISEKKEEMLYREIIKPKDNLKKMNQTQKERYSILSEGDLPFNFESRIKPYFIGKTCPVCNRVMTYMGRFAPTIQHEKPIAKGGKHNIGNISIICLQCNTSLKDTEINVSNNSEVVKVWEMIK